MKIIVLITLLLSAAPVRSGWFDNKDKEQQQQIEQYQHELAGERSSAGGWEILAGVLAVGAIILFIIGTALGSIIRRHEK